MNFFEDAVCKLKTTQIKLKRKYKHYAAFSQNAREIKTLICYLNSHIMNHQYLKINQSFYKLRKCDQKGVSC